ncbi:MAG: tRNA (guanosine(37)-N1)-methyltransferase TrmD [Sporomusaceae bacterium]|nr:tRNA (guanosine(37)-N1)-methyltransferase TrmD [Sporomusaceae bacterium]
MRIEIVSLFPEMFDGPFGHSMIKRAVTAGHLQIRVTNPRTFTEDKHHIVDDTPFGGGSGMVMKPEPIFRAVKAVTAETEIMKRRIILLCPSGETFTQAKAKELAQYEQLIFICGHYEGIDGRVGDYLVDEKISIGDYVLTGGELPAMIITDAVARMIPGVLGAANGASEDSFYAGLLEYPQYTRPREYEGMIVPDILLSGDHAKIERWRRKASLKLTKEKRPDLLKKADLTDSDRRLLREIEQEDGGEDL